MEGQIQPPALGMQEMLASNTCSSAVTKYLKTFMLSTSYVQIQQLPKAKSLYSRAQTCEDVTMPQPSQQRFTMLTHLKGSHDLQLTS